MSVHQNPKSPFYHYQFEYRGRRFHGSTKTANRRDAEKVEREEREKAKALVNGAEAQAEQEREARTSLRLDDIAGRYWQEVGQHHAGAAQTEKLVERLIRFFGPDKRITEITGDDVARLVAWRRGHKIERGGRIGAFVSPTTVNDQTEQLRKLFTRAKVWGVKFDREPRWRDHWLKEPKERVRELRAGEGERLEAAMREDYAPFFAFARASGFRLRECFLRWSEIDWETRRIVKPGKGGNLVTTSIDDTLRAILWPLRGHHPEFVFTYVVQRGDRVGLINGERAPLTYWGVKTAWRRLRAKAGVEGFRFHDFRHDLATKLLRETGNLKLVQRALNHQDVKTTVRYAHVLDEDVAAALTRIRVGARAEAKN